MKMTRKRLMKLVTLFTLVLISVLFNKEREVFASAVGPTDYELRWSFENTNIGENTDDYGHSNTQLYTPGTPITPKFLHFDALENANYSSDALQGSSSLHLSNTTTEKSNVKLIDNEFSLSFWVKIDESNNDFTHRELKAQSLLRLTMGPAEINKITLFYCMNSIWLEKTGVTYDGYDSIAQIDNVPNNIWINIVLVSSVIENRTSLYVNGSLIGTYNYPVYTLKDTLVSLWGNMIFGGSETMDSRYPGFEGYIDDIVYYNDTIDSDDALLGSDPTIADLYQYYKNLKAPSAPTDITLSNTSIDENVYGSTIGTLNTMDSNAGETFTYSLAEGDGDNDNASFNISSITLHLKEPANYEMQNSYSVRIRSTDSSGLYYEETFTISVIDWNEEPTEILLSKTTINDNAPSGSLVGILSSVDPEGDAVTLSLPTDTAGNDNSSFEIVGNELRTKFVADYDIDNRYLIYVKAIDTNGHWGLKPIIITVNQSFDAPTQISLSTNSIAENSASNTEIGTLSSGGVNISDTFIYTIDSVVDATDTALNKSLFAISGNSLQLNFVPDYEVLNIYKVMIRTTDSDGNTFAKSFTITITDVNEAPTDISISKADINDNAASGSTVGTFTGVDPENNSLSYTLVNGTASTDNASFEIIEGVLKTKFSADYDAKHSYSILVLATDSASNTYEEQFTITVNMVQVAPTNINLTASGIVENAIVGTTIGTLSSVDGNDLDSFTYSVESVFDANDNSLNNNLFKISGNSLQLNFAPNYEVLNSYKVTIKTTDSANKTYDKTFTITITNVNEAPTDIALSASSIAENSGGNSTIGTLSSTDPDAGDTFTYSFVAGSGDTDNASFTLSGNSLKMKSSPDYETIRSYSVLIRTTDSKGLTYDKAFTISITDVNEAPTDISLSKADIDDNAASGSNIGTFTGVDPENNSLTYTLVSGSGSTDNASFDIAAGVLKTKFAADYDAKNSYSILVRATDSASNTYDKQFAIRVNMVQVAPTDINLTANSVAENAAIGTTIGALSSVDGNALDTFTYSVESVIDANDNSLNNNLLKISSNLLQLNFVPNYEVLNSYKVTIRTTDSANNTYDKTFTISITNVNEVPTDIALSVSSIVENSVGNSTIGTLTSTDPDTGDTFTYSLVAGAGDTNNVNFNLSGSALRITNSPNYETQTSYSVRIRTTDSKGLTCEKAFTISISDVNETPTTLTLADSHVQESQTIMNHVGNFSATDADSNETFTYTLVNGAGSTDNNIFSIKKDELIIGPVTDYETKSSYSIRVRVTDVNGLYLEQIFTISIDNLNEAPTDITLSSYSILENSAIGTKIADLSAVDQDASDTHTYALIAGTGSDDNNCFTISGTQLKLAIIPNYEVKSSYNIHLAIEDADGLTKEKAFTITITDVNEINDDLQLEDTSVRENIAAGTTVTTIHGTDVDAGDELSYTLTTDDANLDNEYFEVDGNELVITVVPNYEVKKIYNVTIRMTDKAGLHYDATYQINVVNVNEVQTALELSKSNIAENQPSGSMIGTLSSTDPDAGDTFTYTLVTGTGDTDNASFTIAGDKLKLAFTPDYELKTSYLIRIRTTDADGLYYEKAFTITITDMVETVYVPQTPTPTNTPTSTPTPSPTPKPTTEKVTLDVTDGKTDNSVVQIEVERTNNLDGTVSDSIVYEEKKTEETINKLKMDGTDVARIVAPEADKKIAEVNVSISQKSVNLLADADINLEIETQNVTISIPSEGLDKAKEKLGENLYFNVAPITDQVKNEEVTDRAMNNGMLVTMMGSNLSVIGSPMEIKTNIPKTKVDIILPLTGITVPASQQAREELNARLAIYVEHSDGTKEVLLGTLVENADGSFGLKFTVTGFSTFTLIQNDTVKSNQNKVVSVKTPTNAVVKGYSIVATVKTATTKLKLAVSTGGTYKIYADKACTKEASSKLKLKIGKNKVYVKVTAEDGTVSKVYTVSITRKK